MLKLVVIVIGAVVGLGLGVFLVGLALPRNHVATAEAVVAASPDRVAALVREVEDQPRWRSGVKDVEIVSRGAEGLRYRERSDDVIAYLFREERPGRVFRSTITDEALPFGGTWTISLEQSGAGTRVAIREDGEVRNPVFRFMAKFVFGHERTMRAYLADLKQAAEVQAIPRRTSGPDRRGRAYGRTRG